MDDLLQEFLVESHENLDQLDQDLVTLEGDPGSPEILSRIFRTIHTLKGSCGFLGFPKLEEVAHVGENLLSRLRDGDLQIDAEIATALLSLVDAVRNMLAKIESTGEEGDADYSDLIETLTRGPLSWNSARFQTSAPMPVMAPMMAITRVTMSRAVGSISHRTAAV